MPGAGGGFHTDLQDWLTESGTRKYWKVCQTFRGANLVLCAKYGNLLRFCKIGIKLENIEGAKTWNRPTKGKRVKA